MKKILFILILFAHISSYAQDMDTKGFFIKYFCGLDISKNYAEWLKGFDQNSSIVKHEIRNPELTDTIFVNYKVIRHPLISEDSSNAFLNYKLKVNVDSIRQRIIDSIFIIHLYFNYGKGNGPKRKMSDGFNLVRKEATIFGKQFNLSGADNDNMDHYYTGYAYDSKRNPTWPYLFSVTWTKNKFKEYILRLSYFIHL